MKVQIIKYTIELEIKSVELLSPGPEILSPKCGLCHRPIGITRPIALVWTIADIPYRLCNKCGGHLKET